MGRGGDVGTCHHQILGAAGAARRGKLRSSRDRMWLCVNSTAGKTAPGAAGGSAEPPATPRILGDAREVGNSGLWLLKALPLEKLKSGTEG